MALVTIPPYNNTPRHQSQEAMILPKTKAATLQATALANANMNVPIPQSALRTIYAVPIVP